MTKEKYIQLSNRALRQHNHITAEWYAKKASRWNAPLRWHDAANEIAGIAERAGFKIRSKPGWSHEWQVWATDGDFSDLKTQSGGGR